MSKTILITGSTDGIGLKAARSLLELGHRVQLHGRNAAKLEAVMRGFKEDGHGDRLRGYVADFSDLHEVRRFANEVSSAERRLDVLINNAGVYKAAKPVTRSGLDVRFVVNAVAPYLLTQQLLALLGPEGRVINLSSAAQASVDVRAARGETRLSDGAAYAQSKLALTAWTRALGLAYAGSPSFLSMNPGSLLGTKMVMEAFGHARADVQVGADILVAAALTDELAGRSGEYFDNDIGRIAPPHPDAVDVEKCEQLKQLVAELAGVGGEPHSPE